MNQIQLFDDNVRVLSPMNETEARQCVEAIKNHIADARELIYDLHIRDGWKALGYNNWIACVDAEFPESRTHLYRLLDAEVAQRNILPPVGDNGDAGYTIPERQLRPLTSLEPDDQREVWQIAQETAPRNGDGSPRITGAHVQEIVNQWRDQREAPRQPIAQFNRTNDNIEWAAWSWNPVTGCKHGCPYCYARDIANRFNPHGFEPTFHPDRLKAPQNTAIIGPRWDGDFGNKGVFVCSMADLFGKWVPQEWIDATLKAVEAAPQWTFIFLTKNPERLVNIIWPDNAWVGTTVDTQARVARAEAAFAKFYAPVKFVSCEPMQEPLQFSRLDLFNWIIIGGRSKNSQLPEFQPEWPWVEGLLFQARVANCRVYFKTNLTVRPREYPQG